MKYLEVKIETISPMLGTSPQDKEIYKTYIASKSDEAVSIEEELETLTVDEVSDKGKTVFHRNKDGKPIIYDYQIKGFFKDACSMLQRMKGEEIAKECSKIKAYKKIIDGCIFVYPRQIVVNTDEDLTDNQRPLRAQTAQGERISLANSEQIQAGATLEFSVECPDIYEKFVIEMLNYGRMRGLMQWRNAGYGRFKYTLGDE